MDWELIHTCGHVGSFLPKSSKRANDRMRDWLRTRPCQDCARAAEREEVAQFDAERDLPELIGSEKQVAWAASIRMRTILDFETALRANPPADAEAHVLTVTVMDSFTDQASAHWWIEHRDTPIEDLARMALPWPFWAVAAETPDTMPAEAVRSA